MIGMLKGINGAKGISIINSLTGVKQGGSSIRFWDKNKRKKIYYLKIFGGLVGHQGLRLYT